MPNSKPNLSHRTAQRSWRSHRVPDNRLRCLGLWLLAAMLPMVSGRPAQGQDAPRLWANQPARIQTPHSAATGDPDQVVGDRHANPSVTPPPTSPIGDPFVSALTERAKQLELPENSSSMLQTALLLGLIGLAPAVLLMSTCYIRIYVVISLLRQALGAQQLPPNQILIAISIFITMLVMTPVWNEIKLSAIDPAMQKENALDWQTAWQRGAQSLKQFMAKQIEITGNRQAVEVFYRHGGYAGSVSPPDQLDAVPINVILPAYMLSELKVAFLLGFQIILPFLILDLVVATVTVSLGMVMLPPAMVSLPLKLILFVMVDGWNLVVGMLLQSFGPGGPPLPW